MIKVVHGGLVKPEILQQLTDAGIAVVYDPDVKGNVQGYARGGKMDTVIIDSLTAFDKQIDALQTIEIKEPEPSVVEQLEPRNRHERRKQEARHRRRCRNANL